MGEEKWFVELQQNEIFWCLADPKYFLDGLEVADLTGPENFSTAITLGGKRLIVAVCTVDPVIFGAKWLVDQRNFAHTT